MVKKNFIRFDWAIKRLLRNKADYTVLEGFLSVLLNEDIKITHISESESNQANVAEKFNRVDIKAENSAGEKFIIEIQNNSEVDYFLRMLYGVSKAVTEQLALGERYSKICKIFHINIIYFKLGDGVDYVYRGITDFRGIHHNNLLKLTEEQTDFFKKEYAHELFPEYFILCTRDFDDKVKNHLDEWMYYLKYTEIPNHFTAPGLKEAREQLLYDNLTAQDKRDYDYHLEQTRYQQNVIEDAYQSGLYQSKAERTQLKAESTQLKAKLEIQENKVLTQANQIEAQSNQIATLSSENEELRRLLQQAGISP